jgi:GTP pyrophosphokinase
MKKTDRATPPRLTEKLAQALRFARKAHEGQTRKGTAIPYVSHPMAVASIVLEHGGTQDQAVAALLHDTVEDCGVKYPTITRLFGPAVARMVKDCTDSETFPKPPWKQRKKGYLEQLRSLRDPRSLLVSAADKLHNSRAIVGDVKREGKKVWRRFNAAPGEILWYYESLLVVFRKRSAEVPGQFRRLVQELDAVVREMKELAGCLK